jgi:hypothetical protein
MAKKPGANPKNAFVFFDVVYEDGSQRSNRRVPANLRVASSSSRIAKSPINRDVRRCL